MYADGYLLLRVKFLVEFGAGDEGLEFRLASVGGADVTFALNAEPEMVRKKEFFVGNCHGLELIAGIDNREASLDFHRCSGSFLEEGLKKYFSIF